MGVNYYKNNQHDYTDQDYLVAYLKEAQKSNAVIIVYSPQGQPPTYRALETLKMYGFTPELSSVSDKQSLLALLPSLKTEANNGNLYFPLFQLPNGKVIDSETFYNAIIQTTLVDFHPGQKKPYVIVYGIANCPYTAHAEQELSNANIGYDYVDLNSDPARYMGELEARLFVSGYQGTSYDTPLIEVDGYIRPRANAEEIISKLKTH
jgi:glutaredoxin